MSQLKESQHLKIPFEAIQKATENFKTCIGTGGYGPVYKGELLISGNLTTVAVKRLNDKYGQGSKEFLTEIELLKGQNHPNLISLLGYCDDGNEKIIVYEYAERGSLDQYIRHDKTSYTLSWIERLKICIDIACGLDHLHNHAGKHQAIIHRDIKSSNVLLDRDWVAKISDLGLSKLSLAGLDRSVVISHACGTPGYIEPEYMVTGVLKIESDVFSFGMVLLEILCGRMCYTKDKHGLLLSDYHKKDELHTIVDSNLLPQMSQLSLTRFLSIANGCLHQDRKKRYSMSRAVKELKAALDFEYNGAQPGSESPWSLFEDQVLVVLVHDMGPNWELISDAINSTLQFKCIFRKSKECKARHKILMDRNDGDGADSAEDSGSSQTYPSTLPGIPEGSARQLFQRLQGPMEEDTLKSHFEKIVIIGQKLFPKLLQPPHRSHALALSQVFPNNLSGGHVLTPLELSDLDVIPVGYQGFHSGGLSALNHSPATSMLTGLGSTSAPGSSNPVHGSNHSSAHAALNPSVREGRYGIPRTRSLSVNDQQRMQRNDQMLSARNARGAHSVNDIGVHMLSAGNGMGVMCGPNRNMPITKPGLKGIASPSMLSSGPATPNSSSMQSGPGNSMPRPHGPMHMIQVNQNKDQKVSQSGTAQGVHTFGTNQVSQQ
ncbi:hypothetical protein QVD17_40263 [Tagetes erecta]|uniref:Uncharacterized protein n=1 Tax=Tagetes erecta TaxID=13708 RepID=A0AAD8NGV8_TARER|nr:hypothetical protein QVD17_40263 [Tagetes erecta]